MAEPICEDEGLLQEWSPQTLLLQQIPLKIQKGLFSQNLSLTCVDAVYEYIALGTNLGLVYWYYRANGELQRLRLENSNCMVTCIKVVSTVEYMVAAGTSQGTLTVFQIPKAIPDYIPDQLKPKKKQIERFTINGLHNAPITNIEWSQNGMKLFSGDKNGVVVLTEIDFAMHLSKSMELLNEQFEIIQLSYSQQILLISTVYRSIICDGSNNWKVHQVGTKERKILGKFGATFCKFDHGVVLYASRPGHRLWLADKNGVVQQTLIFKSAVQSNCPKIQLINPVTKKEPFDTSFGKVIQFGENKLITYNSEVLYVLHPGAVGVVSVLNNARKILDLAVNENEIFILEGERSLLRISPLPDKYALDMLYQPMSRRSSFNLDEFAAKIKGTAVESIKKITKELIVLPEQNSDDSPPALADEAVELPPIVNLPEGIMPSIITKENVDFHSSIEGNQWSNWSNNINGCTNASGNRFEFPANVGNSPFNEDCHEEVISRPLRKRHNRKPKNLLNSVVLESESDTTSNASEDRMVWGVVNDMSLSDESVISQSQSQSQSSFSVLRDIPTLLNQQKPTSNNLHAVNDEAMKTSDTKSQTSLDTCESVSERLLMSPERMREDQEKAPSRLGNQSMIDSFSSGKADNMSISLNLTASSSRSSKISETLPSPSYSSDNSSMVSRAKTNESQSMDNFPDEIHSSPVEANYWRSNSNYVCDSTWSNQQGKPVDSIPSSSSSRNSLKERFYGTWSNEEKTTKTETPSESEVKVKDFPVSDIKTPSGEDNINSKVSFTLSTEFAESSSDVNEPSIAAEGRKKSSQGGENSNLLELIEQKMKEMDCVDQDPQTSNFTEKKFNDFFESKRQEKKENEVSKPLSSLEPLSYGPPSGSSMLSDFPSISNVQQPKAQQVFFDHWPQYKTPESVTSLSVSKNYIVCTDVHDQVYFSSLSGLALSWTLLDYKASLVRVSLKGDAVWFLYKKFLLALINPSEKSPISNSTIEIAQNVKSFSIDSTNGNGWVVTLSGRLVFYKKESENYLDGKEIPCGYVILDVACAEDLVVALTETDSVICKLPKEDRFIPIKTLKPSISSFALGPENLLWIVDTKRNIYYSDDFLSDDPHWWEIQISDYIFQNSSTTFQNIYSKIKLNNLKVNNYVRNTLIAANENSVWICDKHASHVRVNKSEFSGYIWNKVTFVKTFPNVYWQAISAEGVFEDKGHIWLLSLDGNIFCASPSFHYVQTIPVPCEDNVLCIASSADTLWVLSESGRIYSRLGLTEGNLLGNSWRELKLPQIDNLRLVWVSCGCDVAWGCDINGRTFITIGSPHHMATNIFDAAWLEVEGRPKGVIFEKVFVGPQLYMVWAIDSKKNLYVREGIFSHYQIGTSWVYVSGIEAVHVTISGSSVWALATNGNIYRRSGISENNYIGDYWKSIPGNLKMISTSFTDELWGTSHENEIFRLSYNVKVINGKPMNGKNKESHSSKEDISWEIVE